MQVHVKLLGTLPSCVAGIYPPEGIALDIPSGSTVGDLVGILGIPRERVAIVTINNLLARAGDRIPEHALVKLMQSLAGG